VAEFIYGMEAVKARATYTAYADVNKEYVLNRVKEIEGLTLTWDEFEERWEETKNECFDELEADDQAALVQLYGERAVELEIVSDTAEEDEGQVLAWMRTLLTNEKWCGIADWDDSPLPWNRTGLALDRLVKKGQLVKNDDVYCIPHDCEFSLRDVLCDGCEEGFGWTHIPTKLHKECAQALMAVLSAAIGGEKEKETDAETLHRING
jgi:hypothetical protein